MSALPDPSDPAFDPFTLSLPLHQGASNSTFAKIWPLVERVRATFEPDFVVVQCGVDGLAGDPCAKWNWSLGGGEGSLGWCVDRVVHAWSGRKLLLGGGGYKLGFVSPFRIKAQLGGYHSPNAARAWAHLTSIAVSHLPTSPKECHLT